MTDADRARRRLAELDDSHKHRALLYWSIYQELAAEIGFDLVDTFTGGGSDGNFTAPHTATLDGLGVDGEGAHTNYEQLYVSSIAPRARLLHRLFQTLR